MDQFFRMDEDASSTFSKCSSLLVDLSRCQLHNGRGASLGLLEFEGKYSSRIYNTSQTVLGLFLTHKAEFSYGPLNPPRKVLVCLHICFVGRNLKRLHPGDASVSVSGTVCLRLKITLARKSGANKRIFCTANEQCGPSSEDVWYSTKVSFLSFCCFS